MILFWIGGIFLVLLAVYLIYEFAVEPAHIKEDVAEETKLESSNQIEHAIFEHEKEVADAAQEQIDEGYSQQ